MDVLHLYQQALNLRQNIDFTPPRAKAGHFLWNLSRIFTPAGFCGSSCMEPNTNRLNSPTGKNTHPELCGDIVIVAGAEIERCLVRAPARKLQVWLFTSGLALRSATMRLPRLMFAGAGGDCGKTLVTSGVAAAFRRQDVPVAVFKKGPDYMDSAWLTLAAGRAARNLDTWMMGRDAVLRSFTQNGTPRGVNLIEGHNGVHDGEDKHGTHSSGDLSVLLKTPVVLIVPVTGVTRTLAAIALGIKILDRSVEFAGIILNRVTTPRQESIIRAAVEESAALPVLGSIPELGEELLPSGDLGRVTPEEQEQALRVVTAAADIVEESLDMRRLRHIADNADSIQPAAPDRSQDLPALPGLRIGYFRSPAFAFYYPENLEAIDRRGAVRVPVDPLNDPSLPELDGLYVGGGFPEAHAAALAANEPFRSSVAAAVERGLPVWAECGGLIFLCRNLHCNGSVYPMTGALDADVVLDPKPVGDGYEEVVVDGSNPFIDAGTVMRGHEFHRSRIEPAGRIETAFRVNRGTGLGNGRDGAVVRNALATYLHVHALAVPRWAYWLLNAAAAYRNSANQEAG
jgi:cobyrinic acid a,c-diamide synthase